MQNVNIHTSVAFFGKKGDSAALVQCGLVGARVLKIGKTKITVRFMDQVKEGKLVERRVDVPMQYLSEAFLSMFAKRVTVDESQAGYKAVIGTIVRSCVDLPRFKVEVAHLYRNESLRLAADFDSENAPRWNGVGPVELIGTRLYSVGLKDSSFCANLGDGNYLSPNAATKLVARQNSIASGNSVMKLEDVKVCVVLNTENQFLKEVFASGSLFVTRKLATKTGPARIISKTLGLKAVTSVMGDKFASQFAGFDAVAHAGCVKAGVRGLFRAITGATPLEAMQASNEEVLETVKSSTKTINTQYGKLEVVCVREDLHVTNPYVLYGMEWSQEEGEVEHEEGLYNTAIRLFNEGVVKSLPMYIMKGIENGSIVRRPDDVRVKVADLQNISIAHGPETARQFADKLKASKAIKTHFSAIGDVFTEEESVEIIETVRWDWTGMIFPGSITPENYKSQEAYGNAISFLMFGGNLSSGRRFPGMATRQDVALTVGGEVFVFPAFNNNEGQFMAKEQDDISSGVNLGGAVEEFLQLILSFLNKGTNWKVKAARFNAAMSNVTYREEMNSFNVKGRYMAIMTPTWEAPLGRFFTTRETVQGRVTFKKDPVLFDRAIADVIVRDLPTSEFANLDEVEKFMLSTVAYVPALTQQGQGNDADGDLVCLMRTGGVLPVYEGQTVASKYWDAYKADEQSVNLLSKSLNVKTYNTDGLHAAMLEANVNKSNVGLYTSELFLVQHALDCMLSNGWTSKDAAKIIKETYALTMQDEAVRAIKHESNTSLWGAISIRAALVSEQDVSGFIAKALVEIAEEKLGEDLALVDAQNFVAFTLNSLNASNMGAWAYRTIGKASVKSFFSKNSSSFTVHSMFMRATWIKTEAKLKAEGMTAYKRASLWQIAENAEYGYDYISAWTNRIGNGQLLMSFFNVNPENSICEYVYAKAANQFGGETTSAIELAKEVAAEEVSEEAEVVVESIIEEDILAYFGGNNTEAATEEVVEEVVVGEVKAEVVTEEKAAVAISQVADKVTMSYKGKEKVVAYEMSQDVVENNSNVLAAVAEAVSQVKDGYDIFVKVESSYILNTVNHLKNWAAKGQVSKAAKNKDSWSKIVAKMMTNKVEFI